MPTQCSDCGSDLFPDDLFCNYCGTKIAPTVKIQGPPRSVKNPIRSHCGDCGSELFHNDVYCNYCGTKILASIKISGSTHSMRAMPEPEQLAQDTQYSGWRVFFPLALVFLSLFGYGLTIPASPVLLQTFFNGGIPCNTTTTSPSTACQDASATASQITGITDGIGFVITFFLTYISGHLSDAYGRRPLFIILALSGLPTVLSLSSYLWFQVDIAMYLYLVSRCLFGIFRTTAIALAYCADIYHDEVSRAKSMGAIYGFVCLALGLSPIATFVLETKTIFMTSMGVIVLQVLLACCTPESVVNHKPTNQAWSEIRSNPFAPIGVLYSSSFLFRIALITFFINVGINGVADAFAYYYMSTWGGASNALAILLLTFGASGLVSQTVLLRVLYVFLSTQSILLLTLLAAAVSFVWMGLAPSTTAFLVGLCINGVGFTSLGVIAGYLSTVPGHDQGMLQGANQAVTCLGQSLGPLLLSNVFKYTSSSSSPIHYPAAVFMVAAGFAVLSTCIAGSLRHPSEDQRDRYTGLTQPIICDTDTDGSLSEEHGRY